MAQTDNSIFLLRELARLVGVASPFTLEVPILKQILSALGGANSPSDNDVSLWKKIVVAVGGSVGPQDNKWRAMYQAAQIAGASPSPASTEQNLLALMVKEGGFGPGPVLKVATPTFAPAAGSYEGTQNVVISTTTAGATIYYTDDGTDPTTGSTLYVGAVEVSADTTLKAIGVKAELDNSDIGTAAYTITSGMLPETEAIITRVEADSGEIELPDELNTFIEALVDGGVYNTSIIEAMYIPGFAWKDGGSRAVSKVYDLMPAKSGPVYWDMEPFTPASPQVISTPAGGVDGVGVINFDASLTAYRFLGASHVASNTYYEFFCGMKCSVNNQSIIAVGRGDNSARLAFFGARNQAGALQFQREFVNYPPSDELSFGIYGVLMGLMQGTRTVFRANSQIAGIYNIGTTAIGSSTTTNNSLSFGGSWDGAVKMRGELSFYVVLAPGVEPTTGQRNTIYNALAALFPSAT